MKIAFVTTLSFKSSTMIGRVQPLAEHFAQLHKVHVLHLGRSPRFSSPFTTHKVGRLPFKRTAQGKKRLQGFRLVLNLFSTTMSTAWKLRHLQPDITIIVKPHPHNVAGVWLAQKFLFTPKKHTVLDADDSELTANTLTSLKQRAVFHWAERKASKLADIIITATPWLSDRYRQLTSNQTPPPKIVLIPTGLDPLNIQGSDTTPRLAYLGSLSLSSGHRVDLLPDILTRVHKQNPGVRLFIAGSGDDRATLQKNFSKKHLSKYVTWQGRFGLADIPHLLTPSTILLDPIDASITQRAKSSFRVNLAAVTGLPIVTSNVGIRPRLLPPHLHQRFFAQAGDPADYARVVIDLLENPLNPNDSIQMKQTARQYTWTTLAPQYLVTLTS